MSDIASLGIKINSSDVEKSTKSLEKMVLAAERAEAATKKMEAQMAGFSSTTKNAITEETKRQKSIDNLIKSLTMQEIKLSSGKAALVDYKLSLLGATEAEKKQAAAISVNIKKMEDSALAIRKAERASTGLELVSRTLTSVLTTLGATFGVRKIIDYADMWTMVQGRMSLVTKNTSELIAVQGKLFELAQETRMSFESTADLYTRVARSTESVTKTQNDLLSATENINKAMIISGSSVESANAAIIQLGQGFASGTLQGEELRSVLEQTPRLARAIADGMGVAVGELRKMGKEGKLTSEEVFKAILSQGAVLEQEFGKMPKTVKQGLTLVDNAIMKFIGQMNDSYGVTKTLAGGLTVLSENIEGLAKAGFVLLGAAIPATITAIASAMKALTVIMTRNPIGLIAVGISSAVAAMIAYKDSVLDIGTSTATALEWAKSTWNETGGIIVDWGSKIYTSITESFKGLGDNAGSIAAFIGTTYEENFSKIMTAAKKTINIIVGGFIGTGVSIGNTAAFIYESFENAFNGIVNVAIAAGKDIKKALSGDVDFSNTIQTASENAKKSIAGFNKYIDESASIFKTVFQTDYVGAFGASVAQVGANISKGAKDLHATTMANAKEKTDAEKAAAKALEDEIKATKTAIELSKEAKKEKEASKKLEEDRLKSIADIIKKLQEERDTLDMTKEQIIAYKLALLGATPAQIAFAQAIQKEISAAEERKRVTADFKSLQEKLNPELKRQNDLMADFKVVNDAYAMGLIKTKEEADKLKESLEFNSFSGAIDELKDKLKFEGTNFGNEMADGINNAVISMQKLNNQLDKQAKNQKDIDKLQKEIDTTSNLDLRAKKQKKMDELTEDSIKSQMSGYRQLFGTASQLFKENSREREVMHNIEMAFAAAEIAMNLEKTISAAYLAIAESGTLPPPASFAAIAAMTALMAGIVAAAGGSLSGGGSGSAPTASAQSTQGTGTVMGNPSEKSQSANNALEFMKDIEAKQYNELRDINKGVVDLNNNITNLVTNIIKTGINTSDMGINTGKAGGASYAQEAFIKYANPLIAPTMVFSDITASLTKNIPILGDVTKSINDFLNNTVSTVATTLLSGTKKTSITAQGLKVSTSTIGDLLEGAGLDVQKFADVLTTKKSSWLTGGGTKKYLNEVLQELTPDEESIKIMFTNVFKNVGETMVAISKELNMGDDKLKEIYSYTFDIGKIDLKGLDSEQINEAISSVINTASDQAVTALFGELIGKYVQVGEALLETAIRVVSERAVVLDILEMTGQGFKDSDIPAYSLEVTQSLISVAGGIKELQDASATYYDKFFSDNEKQIRLQGQLTETMASMGQSMPTTRDGFRKIVESLDLTTDAGQRGYVTLLGLSESFDSVFSKIEADNEKKLELELQIMNLTGKGTEALAIQRKKEIESLSEANKPLLARIYALQDEASALEIAKKAEEEANALLKKQADERIEVLRKEAEAKEAIENKRFDLELQILRLTGKESEALSLQRQKEINTLDDVNKPLQERIYALQDEATLLAESKKIEEERINELKRLEEEKTAILKAEADKAKEINDKKFSLEIEIMNLIGKGVEATALLRQKELSTLDEINKPLQERIYALQDEAAALEVSKKIEEERTANLKKAEEERLELLKKEADKAKEINDKKFSLEIDILNLTGRTVEATALLRQRELSSLDEVNRPLQERIYALQDEAAAIAETNRREEEQKQKDISILNERLGLENELLNLQGNIAEIRKRELAAIDESNRSLQERIWNLKDEAEVSSTINSAKQEIESNRQSLLQQLNELTLDTNQLRELELDNLRSGSSLLNEKLEFNRREKALLGEKRDTFQAEVFDLIAKKTEDEKQVEALKELKKTATDLEKIEITNEIVRLNREIISFSESIYGLNIKMADIGDARNKINQIIEAYEEAIASGDTDSLVALQEQIWALEDAASAAAKALKDEEDRINKEKEVSLERASLEIRLLEAQGKTLDVLAITRAKERLALDETNRAIYDSIILLEDKNKAEAELKEIQDKADEERKTLLEKNLSDSEEILKKSIDKQISFYQTMADEANRIFEEAKSLLDRSFASEQETIAKKHESLITGLTTRLEEAQAAASELESVFNSLSDARKSMEGDSGGVTYQAVQKQLIDAISMAKGGDVSGAKGLIPNLGILTSQGSEKYGSQEDYKRDFFKTYNALSEIEGLTGTQFTEQQQIVKNLETQIEQANINNQAMLDALQSQYDAVLGVDKSVISFEEAIIKYQKAQYEADGANTLLKTQTEILNNQLNALLGIDVSILSVTEAINKFIAAQLELEIFNDSITKTNEMSSMSNNHADIKYEAPAIISANNKSEQEKVINEEVVAELRAIRADNARANFELVKNSGESKKTLREWQEIGILTRTS